MTSSNPNFRPIPYGEILQAEFDEPIQYYAPYFLSGKVVVVYSEGGVGKTYYVLHMMEHIACGVSYLGLPTKKAKILYCDCEMGNRDLKARRCTNLQQNRRDLTENLMIYTFQELPDRRLPSISDPKNRQDFLDMCDPFDIVVFDNYLGMVDNSNASSLSAVWRNVWSLLVALKIQNKCVIIVHHTNKEGNFYGTMEMHKDCDVMLELRPSTLEVPIDRSFVEIIQRKSRHGYYPHEKNSMYSSQFVDGAVELRGEKLSSYRIAHYQKREPYIQKSRYPSAEIERLAKEMGMQVHELKHLILQSKQRYGLDNVESHWSDYDDDRI